MEGKSNFPLIEKAVISSENVALGMLCMSSLKPLACVAMDTRVIGKEHTLSYNFFGSTLIKYFYNNTFTRISPYRECFTRMIP